MFTARYASDLLNKIQAKIYMLCMDVDGVLFGCCSESWLNVQALRRNTVPPSLGV